MAARVHAHTELAEAATARAATGAAMNTRTAAAAADDDDHAADDHAADGQAAAAATTKTRTAGGGGGSGSSCSPLVQMFSQRTLLAEFDLPQPTPSDAWVRTARSTLH